MIIKIFSLLLYNFKGAKNLYVQFTDNTSISGDNGTFKSTIFDAFNFLLFGKDQFDKKDFGIKTYDKNCSIIPKTDHGVTGILKVDNKDVTLSRVIKEKWQTKKGSDEEEFTGNETEYTINSVPKKQSEYQDYINSIIPESTFKLLTSPYYFSNLKWEDKREMLISAVGSMTDEEIAGIDLVEVFERMQAESKGIEELKKQSAFQKRKLKDSLAQIPARIDEAHRNMPPYLNFDAINDLIEELKGKLTDIDKQIYDKSESFKKEADKINKVQSEINKLELELHDLEQIRKIALQQNKYDLENEHSKSINESVRKKAALDIVKKDLDAAKFNLDSTFAKVGELRTEWAKVNEEEFYFDEAIRTCPTCKRKLEESTFEDAREILLTNFNKDKSARLVDIQRNGKSARESYDYFVGLVDKLNTDYVEMQSDYNKLVEAIPLKPKEPVISLPTKEEKNILTKIAELEGFKSPKLDLSSLSSQRDKIQEQIDAAHISLGTKQAIESTTKRIAELGVEEKALAQQLADLERFEFKMEQFISRKMIEVETRVNNLCPSVKFRMFNKLINGGTEPVCDVFVNGVPYSDANHAGQINAGIEIINALSKAHDCYAPIFIDNAESSNNIMKSESQMIKLIVTKDKELIVS